MDKKFKDKFYKSISWQRTREAYFKKAKGLCEDCLQRGLIVPGEIVHHVIYITPQNIDNPEITLNFNNLRLLCRACHERTHRREAPRFNVDETGRIIPLDDQSQTE